MFILAKGKERENDNFAASQLLLVLLSPVKKEAEARKRKSINLPQCDFELQKAFKVPMLYLFTPVVFVFHVRCNNECPPRRGRLGKERKTFQNRRKFPIWPCCRLFLCPHRCCFCGKLLALITSSQLFHLILAFCLWGSVKVSFRLSTHISW